MATSWTLATNVTANTTGFKKGMDEVSKRTGKAKKAFGGFKLSLVAVGAAIAGTVAIMKKLVAAYAVQERAEAQLDAVLKSTAHAAGLTADELKTMATRMQNVSTFGDEAIITSQSLLLTFTKIGKDVFPQAQQTILDMATAMGTDLKGATVQLGKALNDPIKGVSALSEVGVSFSEDQKKMIKSLVQTGDLLGAQKIILAELSVEFGGSAAAAAKTYSGQLTIMTNKFGDLQEKLGAKLVPELTLIIRFLNDAIEAGERLGIISPSSKAPEREGEMRKARLEDMTKEDLENWEKLDKAQNKNLQLLKEERAKQDEASWGAIAMGPAYMATDALRRSEKAKRLDEQIATKERDIRMNAERREKIKAELARPGHERDIADRKSDWEEKESGRTGRLHAKAQRMNAAERAEARDEVVADREHIARLEEEQDRLREQIADSERSESDRREDRDRALQLELLMKEQRDLAKQNLAALEKLRAA